MNEQVLIDRIYEAAFVPELWQSVCTDLGAASNAYSASLITANVDQTFRWVSSPNIHEDMERFSQSPLRFQNVRPQRHSVLSPASFMRDIDLMTIDEIASDPVYNEFLYPLGMGWTVGDMVQEPSGHTIIFDLIRWKDAGPFEAADVARLNSFRPHLSRAATISSRLAFERINAAMQALELTGLPAAAIGRSGKVLAANALLQEFAPQVSIGAFDKLRFGWSKTSKKFEALLETAETDTKSTGWSLPLPQLETMPPAVVHIIPVRGTARDIFVRAAYFLIVTPVDRSRVVNAETLQGLFDLSPAEARVARALVSGCDVADTARNFGISAETVRTHVKTILSKCGMNRQSDFVASVTTVRPMR